MKTLILMLLLTISTFGQRYIVVGKDAPQKGRVHATFSSIKGYVANLSTLELAQLNADPRVDYIEPDGYMYTTTIQPVGYTLGMIDQRNISLPPDELYEYNFTGSGVTVFIIDTGVLVSHPDIAGRAREGFAVDHTKQVNCNAHGTMVTGVVGGTIHGVAKDVNLVSVRVFPCTGAARVSDVIKGIDYVRRQQRRSDFTHVANMSLGGGYSQSLNDATQALIDAGTVVVVAAGNSGVDACTQSPSSTPNAITVSGVTNTGYDDGFLGNPVPPVYFTGFNYGTCVDIFAPNLGWTIWYDNMGNTYGNAYFGGTSFSSPHVAGVAALYLEQHPFASPQEVRDAIIGQGTPNILHINGVGSPNLFLYSLIQ